MPTIPVPDRTRIPDQTVTVSKKEKTSWASNAYFFATLDGTLQILFFRADPVLFF